MPYLITGEQCGVDVLFILDVSGSIGITDFNLIKQFTVDVISNLDVDSGQTRVGVLTTPLTDSFYVSLTL